MQNLITFEKALKENYLPAWNNQLGVEPSPLLGKIKHVPLVGDKIVTTAPIGLSGGFGFGQEGKETPASGNVRMEKFETRSKDMYTNIVISNKAVKLATSGKAMADALDTEVKGAYEAAKWNVGRALFGNGTGVLTEIVSSNNSSMQVTDVSKLKEGLIVDAYTDGNDLACTVRIKSIDRATKEVFFYDSVTGITNGGFLTVQGSYNNEITGLGAIFDDNIETIYGINKEANPFLKPIVVDAGKDLTESKITAAIRRSQREKNGAVDTILCGDEAFDAYTEYLRQNNYRVEENSKTLKGGFKAIKHLFGNREVDIVCEEFVPSTEMWGVDSKMLELHEMDWNFAELQGGGIFNLMEKQSAYRALLCNYGELICKNPGACIRIHNCV